MATWISGIAIVGSAALGAYSANKAADASAAGAQAGERSNANALAQQQGNTRQQLELNRPLIQTRDNALNQLNEFFGLPSTRPSEFGSGRGTNGSQLIALPGITTSGVHSQQSTGGGAELTSFTGETRPRVEGGKLFYDPGAGAVVDANGDLVANVPAGGGVIPGLLHGFNNGVEIGADGSITSIGSGGRVQLAGIPKLVKGETVQGTQAATQGRGPDFSNILNLPIFDFQRKQGEGVINRNLAGQGKFFSGQRGQALLGFNNQLVANRINEDYVQPRLTLAGFGNAASANSQNALSGSSANIGQNGLTAAQLAQNQADARASGYQGVAGEVNTGLNNLLTIRRSQQPQYSEAQRRRMEVY